MKFNNKIKIFSPFTNISKQNLKFAEEISFLDGVKEIILLPDSFTKDKYMKANYKATIPSSSVILSKANKFYPQFKSRGINCGMMTVLLPIDKSELNKKFIKELQKKLTHGFLYHIFYMLRLPFFRKEKDLTKTDFFNVLEGNIGSVLKKYEIKDANLPIIEKTSLKELSKYINKKWLNKTVRLRYFFGRYFGGNHFFEIQEVVKVDKNSHNVEGIKEGQLFITFHTGGEALQDIIKKEWSDKYIFDNNFISVKDKKIRNVFFDLNRILMNLGYVYRLATFSLINDSLKKIYGEGYTAKIIVDKNHNSFKLDKINNIDKIIYRHNAEELKSGGLGIVSGNYNHNSYIVEGLDSLEKTLFTIDHGIGNILDTNIEDNLKTEDIVRLYKFKKGIKYIKEENKINIIKNKNIDAFFNFLEKENVLKSVVELKPLVNIKNK